MQGILLVPDNNGMPRISPAGKTDDYLGFLGQIIYDLALPLIAPLGANDDYIQFCTPRINLCGK
jgi:hypothetical protein